jgi:NAD(P)-dependent dehydrogenase (short-subunit alcohol dehydrogenase family)
VNVRAAFVATQAAAKHMKAGGQIITIGSCNADRMPFAGGAAYAMSKAALAGLVQRTGARPRPARHHRQQCFSRGRSIPT